MPPGLAILDAPDIDSVEERNRILAAQLLAAADLWLFVTSAARYADQVPWDFLRRPPSARPRSRSCSTARPPTRSRPISTHLARMLASRGLKDSPLFTVDGGRRSPRRAAARDVGRRRSGSGCRPLADDQDARGAVVQQTLDGAVRTLARRTHTVADAATEQTERRAPRCARTPTRPTTAAVTQVAAASADGTLLRGEVLARWQEFVGTGELLRSLETQGRLAPRPGRQRRQGQAASRPSGSPSPSSPASRRWSSSTPRPPPSAPRRRGASTAAGQILLRDAGEDLGRASRDFRRRAERRGARLAVRRARDGPHRGRRQALDRALPGLRRQRPRPSR